MEISGHENCPQKHPFVITGTAFYSGQNNLILFSDRQAYPYRHLFTMTSGMSPSSAANSENELWKEPYIFLVRASV